MNEFYYSAKNNGFYPLSNKVEYESSTNGWPTDAVLISDEEYQALFDGQMKGKIIVSGDDGRPALSDPSAPSQEEQVAEAKTKRDAMLADATAKILPFQDAVDLDEATEEEKTKLIAWKKYRILLNRVDISNPSAIQWPDEPAF